MQFLIGRNNNTFARYALALLGALAVATSLSSKPSLVRESQSPEPPITISYVNPKFPQRVTDQARALTADVNAERLKRGLSALVSDDTLNRFAYAKASEMASRSYFGHTDPDGITFEDRLTAWHLPASYVAENIAFDADEKHAHTAFMRSPGHAANLLDPREHRMGIAVVTVGSHETFYVEVFSA